VLSGSRWRAVAVVRAGSRVRAARCWAFVIVLASSRAWVLASMSAESVTRPGPFVRGRQRGWALAGGSSRSSRVRPGAGASTGSRPGCHMGRRC